MQVYRHSPVHFVTLWLIVDNTPNHFTSCSSPYSWCGGLLPGGPPPPLTGGGSASSCGEGKEKGEG